MCIAMLLTFVLQCLSRLHGSACGIWGHREVHDLLANGCLSVSSCLSCLYPFECLLVDRHPCTLKVFETRIYLGICLLPFVLGSLSKGLNQLIAFAAFRVSSAFTALIFGLSRYSDRLALGFQCDCVRTFSIRIG